MTVYLKPEDEIFQDRADVYTKQMELTKLVDVVKSIQICFDPSEKSTTIVDDKKLQVFSEILKKRILVKLVLVKLESQPSKDV